MTSSELKGYLTGLIYGDGFIGSGVTKRRFEIKSINKDFIYKIKDDLSDCTNFKITIKEFHESFRNGVHRKKYWMLEVKSHPYFAKKYHHFYDDYKNRVCSKESMGWLNEAGLANWYMSDGYVCLVGKNSGIIKARRVDICTDRYDKETVLHLIDMLNERFNLKTSLIQRKNKGKYSYRIRIMHESYELFFDLIRPHIVESMQYKLYLGYEKQPIWMSDMNWQRQINLMSANALTESAEGKDIVLSA